MISRKWNHNSDPLQRSKLHSQTSAPRSHTFQHWNLYIAVAFCLNIDIVHCQMFRRCCSLLIFQTVYTLKQSGIIVPCLAAGALHCLQKGLLKPKKKEREKSKSTFSRHVCIKNNLHTVCTGVPQLCVMRKPCCWCHFWEQPCRGRGSIEEESLTY